MIPTVFGLIVLLLGLWFLKNGTPLTLICAMVVLGLFHASAAIFLPAIGGSSISPSRLMLLFVLLAVVMRLRTRATLFSEALAANAALGIFCIYGFIGAFVLPQIFAGQINVAPLRISGLRSLKDTVPLTFSPQNITTGVYLVGTGLTAICAYVAMRMSNDVMPVVKAAFIVIWAHAITGILGVVLTGTFYDTIIDFVRNGSYSQTRQGTETYTRIAGLTPEPSIYATFAMVYLVLAVELWLRNVRPRLSGISALLLLGVLIMSTSSTAYVSLMAYGIVIGVRILARPAAIPSDKLATLAMVGVLGVVAMLGLYIVSESVADRFTSMFQDMTVGKSESESGQQRAFWAMQGIDAFAVSRGLGIGAGSFRSSSLITAILGSMGVVGVVTFAFYCGSIFLQGLIRRSSDVDPLRMAIADATGWAALAGLLPLMANAPSPDPGMEFAIFAGISLACRRPALQASMARRASVKGWSDALRGPIELQPKPTPESQPEPTMREVPRLGGWRRSSR